MKILERLRLGGGSPSPSDSNSQKQLNLILTKWNWGGKNPQSAQEFLDRFTPWVDNQIGLNKEVTELLKKQAADNLTQLNQKIEQLKTERGTSEDYQELETERDELKRDKTTLEQEVLAINNRLNLKTQEVKNKERNLEKFKREKNQLEVQQQKALKDKNSLITTLQQEIKEHKKTVGELEKQIPTDKQELHKQLNYFKSTASEIEKIVDSRLVIFMGKEKVIDYLKELQKHE